MAVSNKLAKDGNTPEALRVESTVILDRVNEKLTPTSVEVRVSGRVPGIESAAFEQSVREAGLDCPISRALKGTMDINIVEVELES
jgi:osmotically inducible protein OsmC